MLKFYLLLGLIACVKSLDYIVETEDETQEVPIQLKSSSHSLIKSSQNVTVLLGKKAILPCFVLPNQKFIWMHTTSAGDKIISIGDTIITGDRRVQIDSTCLNQSGCWKRLKIDKIQLVDEGFYVCQADTMRSARVYLNVLVAPYLKSDSMRESLTVSEGDDIELICDADGRPKPTVSWYLTKKINADNNLLVVSPTLNLRNLTRHSHKRYECVAVNGVSPALSRTFLLNVEFKPVLRKLEIKNDCEWVDARPENSRGLVVGCHVNGNPAPEVVWFVNGSQLGTENTALSKYFKYNLSEIKGLYSNLFSKLEIEKYNQSDLRLKFECQARNHLGAARTHVEVCSKNINTDTKSYHYSYDSKSHHKSKEIYNDRTSVAEDELNPDESYFYSRYSNSSDLLEITSRELERLINDANRNHGFSRVQILFLVFFYFVSSSFYHSI